MKTRLAALPLLAASLFAPVIHAADKPAAAFAPKPSLTVTVIQPQRMDIPLSVAANGSITAWQEASVGSEAQGYRLAEVRVNVGDTVKKGQVLAVFSADMAEAELAQGKAAIAEAEANLAAATADAQRARDLQSNGALSAQQINQYLTAEKTAKARLDVQKAAAHALQIRLNQTKVLAADDGIISARNATVGAVTPAGQELFRLIRQGRLEWRAEVAASDLAAIRPGQRVRITPAGGSVIEGKVRMVAPTVDTATRNGLVYVDLPKTGVAKAGMFARGEFAIGGSSAFTLPQTAVLLRDGYSYVFLVHPDNKVRQLKVAVGRRLGDRIEITTALDANGRYVAAGGGFLSDGDLVRVVPAPTR
ncbi:MAG: efflux RND transporter periplasmic adaptor subunit [Fluviicoccus sp.]|uniref:efflux RND transporter periplasmic adaptor subunit n=1 Tax=Fluviicoccus sp. TaxID=2003552 RepID=UPI002720F2F9|nr:efflux RND transporter periplasmic adaptor subunit [Fluviicoccus sp.]MDO8329600.1 efflux RND transporter periplasmic adaptor subunit [Fluviicoccus sp.]